MFIIFIYYIYDAYMACCVMKLRDSKLQNKKKWLLSSPHL